MLEREPDFRVTRLEGDVDELVLNAKKVSYRSAGGSISSSGGLTDAETRGLARGILLADSRRRGGGVSSFFGAVFGVFVVLTALSIWAWYHEGEFRQLTFEAGYESADRTTCRDIAALGGTCRSPLPRR